MAFILNLDPSLFRERVGTAMCGSHGCVTLHAAGFAMEPVIIMPHARGKVPIKHQPGTRRWQTIDEDGRAPRFRCWVNQRQSYAALSALPAGISPVSMKRQSAISSLRAIATIAIRRVRPFSLPTRWRNRGEFASRLITQPKPRQLDKRLSRSRIARAANAPDPVHVATLMEHGANARMNKKRQMRWSPVGCHRVL